MLTLFWIIAGSLVLTILVPVFLFAYLSFEPHLSRRRRHAAVAARRASPAQAVACSAPRQGLTVSARNAVRPGV